MGRPIKKSRMFNDQLPNNEDSTAYAGRIEVTAYYPISGSLQSNDDAYIMRQRGSNRFLISQGDSSTAVYTLKGVQPSELAAGEMCIKVALADTDDSTNRIAYVTRLYNNTIHYQGKLAGETFTGWAKYSLGSAAGEDSAATGFATIDVI
jgi:hypothetical protein